ncbi:hypothetical protein [Paenibacillus massiliensis]|uniref:hypothetical protein n=1 Tax=Paenibacillus massiliensis TaxID=225917 RepID=UPI0003FD7885|nr:hypothetical protein [Paenibacillus massiliensis]
MANVQLPNVNVGETDLKAQVKQLLNAYIMLNEELTFLLNNLDTRNVSELNAEKLVAESIQTDKLAAGSVVADKIDVGELSAISANLGIITAGLIQSIEIYGSYIATQKDTFPRSEMSAAGNLFAGYKDENNYIAVTPDFGGPPSLVFYVNGEAKQRFNNLLGFEMWSKEGMSLSTSSGGISMNPDTYVSFSSMRKIKDNSMDNTLYDQLAELADRIEALENFVYN